MTMPYIPEFLKTLSNKLTEQQLIGLKEGQSQWVKKDLWKINIHRYCRDNSLVEPHEYEDNWYAHPFTKAAEPIVIPKEVYMIEIQAASSIQLSLGSVDAVTLSINRPEAEIKYFAQ